MCHGDGECDFFSVPGGRLRKYAVQNNFDTKIDAKNGHVKEV